jgi:hypothetical protein
MCLASAEGSSELADVMRSPGGSKRERRSVARVRVVSAIDGRHWIVREDGATASLLFASNRAVRRVRDYPADWFDWPDDELLAVSQRR